MAARQAFRETAEGWVTAQVAQVDEWLYVLQIAVDAQGFAHIGAIVFNLDLQPYLQFYYFTNRSGQWAFEQPFPNRAIYDFRLTTDAEGNAHLLFVENLQFALRACYATNAGGPWASRAVETCGNFMVNFCELSAGGIAADSQDRIHFLFAKEEWGEFGNIDMHLHYGWMSGATPNVEHVDDLESVIHAALGVFSTDQPVVLADDGDLYFATRRDDVWEVQFVTNGGADGLRLAVDEADHTHGIFAQNDQLMHLDRSAESIELTPLDASRGIGSLNAIAVDAEDRPVIAYFDETAGAICLARADEKGWSFQTIEELTDPAPPVRVALELDSSGVAHVLYEDQGAMTIRYAYEDQDAWVIETAVNAGAADLDLALDIGGGAHLVYVDVESGEVNYAARSDKSWTVEPIGPGARASLRIDAQGDAHVGYIRFGENNERDLYYAQQTAGEWSDELAAPALEEGWFYDVDLALGALEQPRLAATRREGIGMDWHGIYYMELTDAGWTMAFVPENDIDIGGIIHDWVSLAIDANDHAYVGYQYAYYDGKAERQSKDRGVGYDYPQFRFLENTTGQWQAWVLTPDTYGITPGSLAISPANGSVHFSVAFQEGLWHIVLPASAVGAGL